MKYLKFILIVLCFESYLAVSQPVLENEKLKVEVNEKGAIQFFDKINKVYWGSELPGWIEFFVQNKKEKLPLQNVEITKEKNANSIVVSFNNTKEPVFEMRKRNG